MTATFDTKHAQITNTPGAEPKEFRVSKIENDIGKTRLTLLMSDEKPVEVVIDLQGLLHARSISDSEALMTAFGDSDY